jgi:hypothetical protein
MVEMGHMQFNIQHGLQIVENMQKANRVLSAGNRYQHNFSAGNQAARLNKIQHPLV